MRDTRKNGAPKPRVSIEEARAARLAVSEAGKVEAPSFVDEARMYEDFDLAELARFIDWTPYFAAWDLAGQFPRILDDEIVGEAATTLWNDTQAMMQRVIGEQWFKPKAVVGFYGAVREGDDIKLSTGDTLHTLRQQMPKDNGKPNFALADFVAEGGDHVGAFCVTAGPEAEVRAQAFQLSLIHI